MKLYQVAAMFSEKITSSWRLWSIQQCHHNVVISSQQSYVQGSATQLCVEGKEWEKGERDGEEEERKGRRERGRGRRKRGRGRKKGGRGRKKRGRGRRGRWRGGGDEGEEEERKGEKGERKGEKKRGRERRERERIENQEGGKRDIEVARKRHGGEIGEEWICKSSRENRHTEAC